MGAAFSSCIGKKQPTRRSPRPQPREPRIEDLIFEEVEKVEEIDAQGLRDTKVHDLLDKPHRPATLCEEEAIVEEVEEKQCKGAEDESTASVPVEGSKGAETSAINNDVTVTDEEETKTNVLSCQANITAEKPEDMEKKINQADIIDTSLRNVSPSGGSQPERNLHTPIVFFDTRVKRIRPKAAKGPRTMPRSSASMGSSGMSWSRYLEDSAICLQDSSPLLDKRIRPKAAKGCRTPMSLTGVNIDGDVRQNAFSFGDRPLKPRRCQLTVQTEKSDVDRALDLWSQRVLKQRGNEDE